MVSKLDCLHCLHWHHSHASFAIADALFSSYKMQNPGQVYPQAQMNTGPPRSTTGNFEYGLCGCFSACGTCCLACCCPCVVYGKNQQRAAKKEGCFSDCLIFCLASSCGLHCCVGANGRGIIRGMRGINGGFLGDCCAHFCCGPCALTQERRELESVGL